MPVSNQQPASASACFGKVCCFSEWSLPKLLQLLELLKPLIWQLLESIAQLKAGTAKTCAISGTLGSAEITVTAQNLWELPSCQSCCN